MRDTTIFGDGGDLPRPQVAQPAPAPPPIQAERQRLAEMKRARKAARQARGML